MVIDRILLPDLQKVSGEIERKVVAVAMSNLLTDCQKMIEDPYKAYYPTLLITLVDFFELPQDETLLQEDQVAYDEDNKGYQAAYSQLLFARNPKKDPLERKLEKMDLI